MKPCHLCDKVYNGKHGRSIFRRHLQSKHNIPLSSQPRKTRWDNDSNRPKDDDERRNRMLQSKRRWAARKRESKRLQKSESTISSSSNSSSINGTNVFSNVHQSNNDDDVVVDDDDDVEDVKPVINDDDKPKRSASRSSLTPFNIRTPLNKKDVNSNQRSTTNFFEYSNKLPPLRYPLNAPPSVPKFSIFVDDNDSPKSSSVDNSNSNSNTNTNTNNNDNDNKTSLPSINKLTSPEFKRTPFKPPHHLFTTPLTTMTLPHPLSSPANQSGLASRLGLAPTPVNDRSFYSLDDESPIKFRERLPSVAEIMTTNDNDDD